LQKSETEQGEPTGHELGVSVVVPAFNAADTLAKSLQSVLDQTVPDWEVIVVDDGSEDDTRAIAHRFVERDGRFQVLAQPHRGVSAARNAGINAARMPWLLFLDSDDLIDPSFLQTLTQKLNDDRSLDAVYCRWRKVSGDREIVFSGNLQQGDLFPAFAERCFFAIHTCLVRSSVVKCVGAFDTSFDICEDWDMWQRVARAGARFAAVDKVLADYCVRSNLGPEKTRKWLASALRVLHTGHGEDPRLSPENTKHPMGMPPESLPAAVLYYTCWLVAAMEADPVSSKELIHSISAHQSVKIQPEDIADCIFEAHHSTAMTKKEPDAYWQEARSVTGEICCLLEAEGVVSELGPSVVRAWERSAIQVNQHTRPWLMGASYAIRVEATDSIPDVQPPPETDRLYCSVTYNGADVGMLELPVFDGLVSRYILEDAIAAEFAWPILGHYFHQTVYGLLERSSDGSNSWSRNGCTLATGIDRDDPWFHDTVGWAVFLQELWNRPCWSGDQFYEGGPQEDGIEQVHCGSSLTVEVSDEVRGVVCESPELELAITIGGATLGVFNVSVGEGGLSAKALISAISLYGGMELCRLAVRQALVGRSVAGATLRERLAESARILRTMPDPTRLPDDSAILSIGRAALADLITPDASCVFIPRYAGPLGTSASRRAQLPGSIWGDVQRCSAATGQPLVDCSVPFARTRVLYSPDLIGRAERTPSRITELAEAANDPLFGRVYWEGLFARKPDPWRYGNSYEQVKYEQTLSLVPGGISKALELACAEGFFTEKLAPKVGQLLTSDISQIAVERTALCCARHYNIQYQRLDLIADELPQDLDLIVCSEMLYFMGDWPTLNIAAQKLTSALKPGGYLLTAHANLIIDEPEKPGFDWQLPFGSKGISDALLATGLQCRKEIRTPLYRVQLYQKSDEIEAGPEVIEAELQRPLPENIAAMARWGNSGPPAPVLSTQAATHRLPILMYHRVAPAGAESLARYRVHPDDFEEQIRFLKEAGYYSATLEQWRIATESRRPLPGRAVILTFDDAYRDFQRHAWPVLKRYSFTAMVFVVTGQIGGVNEWDRADEELELLTAEEIQALDREGVVFGSHSHFHNPLLTLSPEEVAREHLVSRTTLEGVLGHPVDTMSYPFGATDCIVQHLAGASGFVYGVTTRFATCRSRDPLLALPRLEISGQDNLEQFIAKLTNED
jgi:peptidoglycan/xylan/chitin deacetylase (PgdA/CDA1 family)